MKYNLIAVIRKDKEDKDGLCPIYINAYSGAQLVAKFSTGQKVHSDNWNKEERKIRKADKNATLKNALVNKKLRELDEQILTGAITSDTLKTALEKEKFKEVDFFEFANKQLKEKQFSEGTRRSRVIWSEKLKTFLKGRSVKLSDVDYNLLQQYEHYLRSELNNANNTVWNSFKFIRAICNDAVKIGYLKESPFKKYPFPKYRQTERTYLTAGEIKKLEAYAEEVDGELHNVIKQFLFMVYTGLSFSDASRFRVGEHVYDNERIIMNRKKTAQPINLLINSPIRDLLPFMLSNPIHCSQEHFNRMLKVIATGAKIKKRLTSHVGRHSFASRLVDLGVSMDIAKGLLAHGSAASTRIYYHVKTDNLDEAMKKFNNSNK